MPVFPATGKYLEEFVIGEEKLTPGRTISSADIELFAQWSGDTASSRLQSAGSGDGRRIVSPILIVNLTDALVQRLGVVEGTGYCNLGWTWTYLKPVYEMETIWVRVRWTGSRPSKSMPHVGILEHQLEVINQDEEVVATATWTIMVLRKLQA